MLTYADVQVLVYYRIHDRQISPSGAGGAGMGAAWRERMTASADAQVVVLY
jgi:hypothetical protein